MRFATRMMGVAVLPAIVGYLVFGSVGLTCAALYAMAGELLTTPTRGPA